MDALALLCNLHGDGPQTLERLRRAGCRTLSQLAAMPSPELARRLGRGVEAARRFQREGLLLVDRLGIEPPERRTPSRPSERRPEVLAPLDERVDASRSELGSAGAPAIPRALEARAGASPLSRREVFASRPAIDAVLEAWRARDAADPLPPLERACPPAAAAPKEAPLVPGAIPGLCEARVRALAEAGIVGLAGLASADPLGLSRASGLPYTAALRLSYQARRALSGAAGPADLGPQESPAARPPDARAPEAGGPFA
jgi:predicted RecB family nuclease